MHLYDTNVLIHFMYQYQDELKHKISKELLAESINSKKFIISPVIIQEFIYASAKIDKKNDLTKRGLLFFASFIDFVNDRKIIMESYELAEKLNYFQNINDCIHIKFADRHCTKLITFDKDLRNSNHTQN